MYYYEDGVYYKKGKKRRLIHLYENPIENRTPMNTQEAEKILLEYAKEDASLDNRVANVETVLVDFDTMLVDLMYSVTLLELDLSEV